MGASMLDEAEYRALQRLGDFDRKTSSWIATPPAIRQLGGALFCDRRYGQVFTYHNGAESYYAARASGFALWCRSPRPRVLVFAKLRYSRGRRVFRERFPRIGPVDAGGFPDMEAAQPTRFELANGVVRAMTGGTQQHDRLRGAVFAALHRQLRGKPCRASLDVRIACPNGNVRYPDVAIDFGPFDPKGLNLREPRLVVEVLSPSTTATHYLVKTEDYSSVPSIAQYWIASQESHASMC